MKNRTLFYLLFFQLIALTLLFPYTPKGEEFMANYFPSVNLREEELIPPPTPAPMRTEDDGFSDELLARLHQLGMPMILELREDGRGVLGIFDQAIALKLDAGSMLVFSEGKTMPFFYLDGRLRVQDGEQFMIFERRS